MDQAPGQYGRLALFALALLFGMSAWFSAAAILPDLSREWSLAPGDGAYLTIAVQLGFVAGALVSAFLTLADTVPPRYLILCGAVVAAGANLGLLRATGLAFALPCRFMTGAALALLYPPYMKVVAEWFRAGRGTALGIMLGALTLGTAAPHLVRGIGGAGDWRVVVIATSALTLLSGLITVFAAKDGPFPFKRGPFNPRQVLAVVRHRGLRLTAFGYFGHMWELYAFWAWFPLFLAERMTREGWSPARVSFAAAAAIGMGSVGCVAGGRISDRRGRPFATALALTCSGSAAFVIGFAPEAAWVAALIGAWWGFWVNADSAQFTAIVSEIADQAYVGTALTLQLALGFLLTNVTLWLVPLLHERFGWAPAFAMLALGPIGGVNAMMRLAKGKT